MPSKHAKLNDWLTENGLPTYEELQRRVGLKDGETAKGAVVVADRDGRIGLAPHTYSALEGPGGKGRYRKERLVRSIPTPAHMQPLPDPVARSGAARVASLMQKLVTMYREHGTLGLSDEFLQGILGSIKIAGGRADLTTEDLRKLAEHFLEAGRKENLEAERKRKVQEVDQKLREGSSG